MEKGEKQGKQEQNTETQRIKGNKKESKNKEKQKKGKTRKKRTQKEKKALEVPQCDDSARTMVVDTSYSIVLSYRGTTLPVVS